jgi:hypothetical protein
MRDRNSRTVGPYHGERQWEALESRRDSKSEAMASQVLEKRTFA